MTRGFALPLLYQLIHNRFKLSLLYRLNKEHRSSWTNATPNPLSIRLELVESQLEQAQTQAGAGVAIRPAPRERYHPPPQIFRFWPFALFILSSSLNLNRLRHVRIPPLPPFQNLPRHSSPFLPDSGLNLVVTRVRFSALHDIVHGGSEIFVDPTGLRRLVKVGGFVPFLPRFRLGYVCFCLRDATACHA